jgi:hypothetical protein
MSRSRAVGPPRTLVDALGTRPEPPPPLGSHSLILKTKIVEENWKGRSFRTEKDFVYEVVVPLLKACRFRFTLSAHCRFKIGAKYTNGRVDVLIKDGNVSKSLIEAKRSIVNKEQLSEAVAQARSYANQLGLQIFAVAAPQGIWVYHLHRASEFLALHVTEDQFLDARHAIERFLLDVEPS